MLANQAWAVKEKNMRRRLYKETGDIKYATLQAYVGNSFKVCFVSLSRNPFNLQSNRIDGLNATFSKWKISSLLVCFVFLKISQVIFHSRNKVSAICNLLRCSNGSSSQTCGTHNILLVWFHVIHFCFTRLYHNHFNFSHYYHINSIFPLVIFIISVDLCCLKEHEDELQPRSFSAMLGGTCDITQKNAKTYCNINISSWYKPHSYVTTTEACVMKFDHALWLN